MKRRAAALKRCNAVLNEKLAAAETVSDSKWDIPSCWHMTLNSVIPLLRDVLTLTEVNTVQIPENVQPNVRAEDISDEPIQNCSSVETSNDFNANSDNVELKSDHGSSQKHSSRIIRIPKKKLHRSSLVVSFQTDQRRFRHVECPYFLRVGCCPNMLKCSFTHTEVDMSTVVLLPNMYRRFALMEPSLGELAEEDFWLHYDEDEIYDDFCNFYLDAISVLRTYGRIIKTVVCRNAVHYLRGNVYIEYREYVLIPLLPFKHPYIHRCTEAFNALTKLHNRWYDRQQLSPRFVYITWSNAICGLPMSTRNFIIINHTI
ncbi:hypothetical protein TTRE_0000303601 [Trichuris trichiura]|uniref:C3H1-type domain-containing protein n=1 Tax=Trichuris trichiura TaxID=36087 RepID=A0A077Z402_TRITR|nr:hypothetical protein TTRE_0000303601 [Trichuris trichiura]